MSLRIESKLWQVHMWIIQDMFFIPKLLNSMLANGADGTYNAIAVGLC